MDTTGNSFEVNNYNPKFDRKVTMNAGFYGDIITEYSDELRDFCNKNGIDIIGITEYECEKYNLSIGSINNYVRVNRFSNEIRDLLNKLNYDFFFREFNEELDRVEHNLRYSDESVLSLNENLKHLYERKGGVLINVSGVSQIVKFIIHQTYLKFVYRICLEMKIKDSISDY